MENNENPQANQIKYGQKIFPQVKLWLSQYGSAGSDDQRAVQVFMDCETRESHISLKNELMAICSGNYDTKSLDVSIGKGRSSKYGSYDAWGKLMLQWMAAYKV